MYRVGPFCKNGFLSKDSQYLLLPKICSKCMKNINGEIFSCRQLIYAAMHFLALLNQVFFCKVFSRKIHRKSTFFSYYQYLRKVDSLFLHQCQHCFFSVSVVKGLFFRQINKIYEFVFYSIGCCPKRVKYVEMRPVWTTLVQT